MTNLEGVNRYGQEWKTMDVIDLHAYTGLLTLAGVYRSGGDMASEVVEVAALGRPFTLGMLYNAQKDELLPGITLWDDETLKDKIRESAQPSCEFKISSSDSTDNKSSLLDVSASLKASFLGGLIEVGGSAKYMNDRKKHKNQSRVTCQYTVTTRFKQLSVTPSEAKNTKQIDNAVINSATHVVTGILYGANAFFVFDSEKLDASSVQDIKGKMEAIIKKIPSLKIERDASLKLNDLEKALTDKFTCKFYGDFILDTNPVTFEDAVNTYKQLPHLLGENKENVVPLKVWMTPLKIFHSEAAEVNSGISIGLVRKAHDALEDLHHMKMICNDLLADEVARYFPQIHEKLSRFQTLCDYYVAALQDIMKNKLAAIRAGKEEEKQLEKVFDDRDKSPFSHEKLTEWMSSAEREVIVIASCLKKMKGIKVVVNQSELEREVLDLGEKYVLCFVFTSLETTDPFLQEMSDNLDPLKVRDSGDATPTQDKWFSSDGVITKMREKAQIINDFANAQRNSSKSSFLVAASSNGKYKGASIYHYKGSNLVTDDFSGPDVKDVTDRNDLIWYSCDLNMDPETANCYLTLSEGNKKATHGEEQLYPDLPQRFNHLVQVLCREALTGRCYWEVEMSTDKGRDAAVGVCYGKLHRKGDSRLTGIGWNTMSWNLGYRWQRDPVFYAEHDIKEITYPVPSGFRRLGVFLDWPAGTLSYYMVSYNTLSHIHTFNTTFTEPVYVAMKLWTKNSHISLCL